MICTKLENIIILIVRVLKRNINDFCRDNDCEVVTMCSPIEYYAIVVYKEVKDEN